MTDSRRYFQLTQNILIEYIYYGNQPVMTGESESVVDLMEKEIGIVENGINNQKYIYFQDLDDGFNNVDTDTNCGLGNFVLPVNISNTKYVKVRSEKVDRNYFDSLTSNMKNNNIDFKTQFPNDYTEVCCVVYDRVIVHFTNRQYFGNYDALIFNMNTRTYDDSVFNLASFVLKRTDMVNINENPILINQNLYTTHIEFRIPSVNFLCNNPNATSGITSLITPYKKMKKNDSIVMNLMGVKSTYENINFTFYNTELINTISIPSVDSYAQVSIDIREAEDGDYFIITPYVQTGSNTANDESLSNYIKTIDEYPEAYIIMHEISLYEYYVDYRNKVQRKKTHSEYHIINLGMNNSDEEIDSTISYRPIAKYGSRDVKFVIEVVLKILNTNDNTTILKRSELEYSTPSKYGKELKKIYLGEVPAVVNVFNKTSNRLDDDLNGSSDAAGGNGTNVKILTNPYYGINIGNDDTIKLVNSSGFKNKGISNYTFDISVLVNCTNIGVSVQQITEI